VTDVFLWWLTATAVGLAAFPLAWRAFPALRDRGYGLSRALGLLGAGYAFWMLTTVGATRNDLGGAWAGAIVLASASASAGWGRWREIAGWMRENRRALVAMEALFLGAYLLWCLVRAANPEITATEKPMELMFLNSILRSPAFPPRDAWLSGYAISYYYFGYVLAAWLTRITGVFSGVAFNLTNALWFALTALGAASLVYNLLPNSEGRRGLGAAWLAPVFVVLAGNLEGFLEVLHARRLFWQPSSDGSMTSVFWKALGIKELIDPPLASASWLPPRFLWWWRASRVVHDVNLAGADIEVIDEFPFFSFLLADNHPHVLALPFVLLAIGFALNVYLGWRSREGSAAQELGEGVRIALSRGDFWLGAWLLGALAFLNTWDFPIALALLAGTLAWALRRRGLQGIVSAGWTALSLGAAAFGLYLLWYLGFSSQAGGILPNVLFPTSFLQFSVMFAPALVPIAYWLVRETIQGWRRDDLGLFLAIAIGTPLALLIFAASLGAVAMAALQRTPEAMEAVLAGLGAADLQSFMRAVIDRRLAHSITALVLGAILGLCGVLLRRWSRSEEPPAGRQGPFLALLIGLATLLVLTPEFVYLKDSFGSRMNTVFKFYYAAWILWGLAAACIAAEIVPRRWADIARPRTLLLLPVALGMVYPVLATWTKTDGFRPPNGLTMDGITHLGRDTPADAEAIAWINGNLEDGVIAEVVGGVLAKGVGGSYSAAGRISAHTGLPTVLGWPGHELQWRGGGEEMGSREQDIHDLYVTRDWDVAQPILARYGIDYVYVGPLERAAYPDVFVPKFDAYLEPVYQSDTVTIYAVPPQELFEP
jgi:YYY domain-containing protein